MAQYLGKHLGKHLGKRLARYLALISAMLIAGCVGKPIDQLADPQRQHACRFETDLHQRMECLHHGGGPWPD